ncbi:hypothetical protein [Halovivax sp.]|uniref:hypothetical protein n=1 Tax=Halovivax sp. TaxID=1935978 RepID=UPI0025BE3467|nr:hypothetical protein [Halovivax sp.]
MSKYWGTSVGAVLAGLLAGALLAEGASTVAVSLGLSPLAKWILAVCLFVVGFFAVMYAFYAVVFGGNSHRAEPT